MKDINADIYADYLNPKPEETNQEPSTEPQVDLATPSDDPDWDEPTTSEPVAQTAVTAPEQEPAPAPAPTSSTTDSWTAAYERLKKQQRVDRDWQLDYGIRSYLTGPDCKFDDETFRKCDEWFKERFGFEAHHGDAWNGNTMKPYEDAHTYANDVMGFLKRGTEAVTSTRFNEIRRLHEAGDMDALDKALGVEHDYAAPDVQQGATGGIMGIAYETKRMPRDTGDIEAERNKKLGEVYAENFIGMWQAANDAFGFDADENYIIRKAVESRNGLEDERARKLFHDLCYKSPERGAAVMHLIQATKKEAYGWMRDAAFETWEAWKGSVGGYTGLWSRLGETYGDVQGTLVEMEKRPDKGMYYWNDAEKQEYARLLKLQETMPGKYNLPTPYDMMVPDPLDTVNRMCARRMAEDAMPAEEKKRRRKAELMLEDATKHAPIDHGVIYSGVVGGLSSIPYMGIALVPGVGIAANTLNQFENTRDTIIQNGGDPDEAVAAQMLMACAWSAVERLELTHLAKPLTQLQKRAVVMNVVNTSWKNGKMKAIGNAVRTMAPEAIATLVAEDMEEGIQGFIERGTISYLTPGEDGKKHDLAKAIGEGTQQFFKDFAESTPTMVGLVGIGSVGKYHAARKYAYDYTSLRDFAEKHQRAINMLRDTLTTPQAANEQATAAEAEAKRKSANDLYFDCAAIWNRHMDDKTGGTAAMDEIREKYALTDDQTRAVGDALDFRWNLGQMASADAAAEYAILDNVGGAFRIGADTTYDPVDLMNAINPNIQAEWVDMPAKEGTPTDEMRQAAEAAHEAQVRVNEATVGSERRHAERELRKANKRIKRLREKGQEYTPVKRIKVTLPVGTDGETRSYYIEHNYNGADIHSPGFAQSVSDAMRDAADTEIEIDGRMVYMRDGEKIPLEDFKAMPKEDKPFVAMTQEQYLSLTDEERANYVTMLNLESGGDFRVLDARERKITGSEGLVEMMRAFGKLGTRPGGNWTLAHEHGHAITSFAREIGAIDTSSKAVTTMRRLFGDPTKANELWNEEQANNAFADHLRDKYDYRRLTPEERKTAKSFFKGLLDTIKGLFAANGKQAPVAPVERTARAQAFEAAMKAIETGDFSGLDAYADMDIGDVAQTTEPPAASAEAPAVANAASDAGPVPASPDAATAAATTAEPATDETPPPRVTRAPAASNRAPETRRPTIAGAQPPEGIDPAAYAAAIAAIAADPEAFAANQPKRAGGKRTVFTPDYSMQIEAETMWTPLDTLVESTDDREVQMRDRTRMESDDQVVSKTRRGVFKPIALFPGMKSDDGAPIVGNGQRIISGHGRKRMLDLLAKEGRFDEYLTAANAEAARQGLPTAPEGMKNPVLVLRVVGGLDTRDKLTRFAELSNRWGGLQRSVTEFAESDANVLDDRILGLYAPDASGNLLAASNREFMAEFLKAVGATGLKNKNGTPAPEAANRVQRAMMTAIFGNDEKVRDMVQTLIERDKELSLTTLQNALMKSAGKLLAMKRKRGSFDIVADVREAAYRYIDWRVTQKGNPKLTLNDHLNQNDFFASSATPMQQALTKLLAAERFGAVIDKYASLVAQQASDAQMSLGSFEARTPLQLLGYAERSLIADGETPVTPAPDTMEAAAPVQSPPAISEEPTPTPKPATPAPSLFPSGLKKLPTREKKTTTTTAATTTAANESAQATLTPTPPAIFTPVPAEPGTATLPGPGAAGIDAYEVNAYGQPVTDKKSLPPGAWNLLRAPYDVTRAPNPSAQDRAGRGLGIANPSPTAWDSIFPHFMGQKEDMSDRTSQAIRNVMTDAERAHYTTVVDYFGGGGCWGLYHALVNFPNANRLIINEFDADRLEKIRLLQEIDGQVADEAEAIIFEPAVIARIKELANDSSSPHTVSTHIEKGLLDGEDDMGPTLFDVGYTMKRLTDPRQRAVIRAFVDCASTMLATEKDENGNPILGSELGIRKTLEYLRADGAKAKEAADAYKARGGVITYRAGDAATFDDAPHGHDVMTICDPPYYLTTDYKTGRKLGLPLVNDNWSYTATRNLLKKLVDFGDGIVYTDEAWWNKKEYTPDSTDANSTSLFREEQRILLDVINMMDHFDVAGRVAIKSPRQETLGIQHGHTTEQTTAGGASSAVVRHGLQERQAPEGTGADDTRHSVRLMAGGTEGDARPDGGTGAYRGRARRIWRGAGTDAASGSRALARTVIAQDIAAAVKTSSGLAPDADAPKIDAIARDTLTQVRDARMADYAAYVRKNAHAWKTADITLHDGVLPIPYEMRADRSLADVRYSVILGERGAYQVDKIDKFSTMMADLSVAMEAIGERKWNDLTRDEKVRIKAATGWEQGADGKWRRETEDLKIIDGFGFSKLEDPMTFTLGDIFADNPIFKAYPDLKNVVVRRKEENIQGGRYNPSLDEIEVNAGITFRSVMESTLAHEVQHAIQYREGFGIGGPSGIGMWLGKYRKFAMEGYKILKAMGSTFDDTYLQKLGADYAYNHLAGEIEANNASNRKFADALKIGKELLEDTESVPRSDQFVLFDFMVDDDVRYSVAMGNRAKEEARAMIEKYRPDYKDVDKTVDQVAAFDTPKERKAALYWFCKNTVRLPEDSPKVVEAIKTAEKAKIDPLQFERPGEILEKYAEYRPTEPPINPDTVPELSDRREMGNGIVTYLVRDDKQGQAAMRRIINTHFGKDANPWCLLQGDGNGNLSYEAYGYWEQYNALPKRVAFRNGKLVAFMATDSGTYEDEHREFTIDESMLSDEYREIYRRNRETNEEYAGEGGVEAWLQDNDSDEYYRLARGGKPVAEQWWDRADEPHDFIPFTRSVPSPSGEGRRATEHCEMLPDGTINVFKITRGEPNAKNGVYEQWFGTHLYVIRETKDGEEIRREFHDENDVELEHFEKTFRQGFEMSICINKDHEGKIWCIDVKNSENGKRVYKCSNKFEIYDGLSHESTIIRTNPVDEQTARELYRAFATGDDARATAIIENLKRGFQTPETRHSVRIKDNFRSVLTFSAVTERDAKTKVKSLRDGRVRFTNALNGRTAELKSDWTKIFSLPAKKKSDSYDAHYAAANRIDTLFENGVKMWEEKPRNGSSDIRVYAKYGCPFEFNDSTFLAKLTVKEYATDSMTDGFYSVEAISVEKISAGGINAGITSVEGHELDPDASVALSDMLKTTPDSIAQTASDVNRENTTAPAVKTAGPESPAARDAQRHSVFAGESFGLSKANHRSVRLQDALDILSNDFINVYTDEARDAIYIATGWWKGTDGKWRIEIEDLTPRKRRGKTLGDGTLVNGLYHDDGKIFCHLPDIVNHSELFDAYPEFKKTRVLFVDPDDGNFDGRCDFDENTIELAWDSVKWAEDEPSNVLTTDGLKTLTHEIQHMVQELEGFATGGSESWNGPENYYRLAGETEARNAERRIGIPYSYLADPNATQEMRGLAVATHDAPWQTEDVAKQSQILYDAAGRMVDTRGRRVPRHSVRRGSTIGRKDFATSLFAAQRLAGKEIDPESADRMLRNLGVTEPAASVIARADRIADANRDKLQKLVAEKDPRLVSALVGLGYEENLRAGLERAITGAAEAANPEIGIAIQKQVQKRETAALMAAHGFDAAAMMAELPISLADGLLATVDRVKTPEELAKEEAAKKKREEEAEAKSEEELAEELEDQTYREPTDEERAYYDELMDRARFKEEARQAEANRKKAEKAKRKAEEAAAASETDADEGETDEAGDSASDLDAETILPAETIRRIAPVFDSPELFASFVIEWTSDKVCEKHPNLDNNASLWKSPVAIRELKQTATHILRQLAKDVLGSPSLNYARNFADHAINELESDAECKTFNAVHRKIAKIYDSIHANALKLSRRKMVKNLIKEIRKTAIERGRFSAIREDLKRKIDAKTELWCRHLIPALTMAEDKLNDEIARLKAILTITPGAADDAQASSYTEDQLDDMATRLALLQKYGGMVRWMPGKIADAEAEIMEMLNGKLAAHEQRREEAKARDAAIRTAIINAVNQGASANYRKPSDIASAAERYGDAMMGNLTIEMQNLIRYCTDPELRQKALEAIEEMQIWISEGGSRYRTILGEAQAELHDGLKRCYGNAEDGIKHLLREALPENAAKAIFTQSRDRVPTYGQLIQLYASTVQRDYKKNAEKYGRDKQIALMESTLTDADRRFHAWAVQWYKRNRKALSDSVEAVTGLPVTSPDALYTPVRVLREKSGFDAEGMGWSPVPSALNRRVAHERDFNEDVNFLACLQEQAEVRAQTIGYAEIGIRLRDTITHRDVQAAVRQHVSKKDMKVVSDHVRDVLLQNATRKDESAFWGGLNIARRWMARFYLSGNIPSAVKQLASMPVWANALLGGKEVGLTRCLRYLTTVASDEGRSAIRELMASDGFKARYTMGWSEETQNVLMNPSRKKIMRFIERAYDRGMVVNKAVDAVSCLWMAQGFYRDATQTFLDKGLTIYEAKRKAMALTWSTLESGQQSGRVENMNTLQRRGGAGVAAIFQFKTAYLLQNNYLIQAIREMRAGTPGARGRFLRALFINAVYIPTFVAVVNAAWSAIMGDGTPDDETDWPKWFADFAWSMIDGITAPMFGINAAAHSVYEQMTDTSQWTQDGQIPALSGAIRVSRHAGRVVYELGKYGAQAFDCFDFEEELTGEKLAEDVNRLIKDLIAPYRHASKAYSNRADK